ncbi:hypothetical protein RS030_2264 [Cryptosporidium xiaoi]|uniref:Uncharacterized protein n=1 Tax=Cryptosporidium xiaoi TaxID=659607 RepID=A0AAV9XWG5_9CRYT
MESGEKINRIKTKTISSIGSKSGELSKNSCLPEPIENDKTINIKGQYDGLTDMEDEKPKRDTSIDRYRGIKKNTVNFKDDIYNVFNKSPINGSHSEQNSDLSSSGENTSEDSEDDSNTEISDDSGFTVNEMDKFDIRGLKPMETLTWLRDHGMGKMANLISREREDSIQQKVNKDSILGFYNANIKDQDHEYLKKLFITSLGETYKVNFESETFIKNREERKEDLNNEYTEIKTFENLDNVNVVQSKTNDKETISRFIKPKLINRIEVTEESISGENALAFQKYIRDLQEEVKMKDEKLRLREMERDNARLTRDQLTRAVKSSLEIGNGVGNLDYIFKNIIERNLTYSFRMLQLKARINLKNKLGSEIFAGASLLKHIILKRLKHGFKCLSLNVISKNDSLFWKKNIVNTEEVASNIISKFKNILPCYKLVSIVQHNHICALKKFLYIWTKCSGLKGNTNDSLDIGYNPFQKRGVITLRELKIAVESDLKNLSNKDKRKFVKANKGFFMDTSIDELRRSNLINPRNLSDREILRNINDRLSLAIGEKPNFLSMLISNNQEQKNIDIARNNALDHLSEIIYSISEDGHKPSFKNTLNKINDLSISYREKLASSFENLILNKNKFDFIDEVREHVENRFKKPVKVPDFIEKKHLKLLEDFYSNPFYHVFVNEYNKRTFLGYKSSSSEEDELENYDVEVDEGGDESECDIFYFNSNNDTTQLTIQQQIESNVDIEPESPIPLEVVKTEDLYIKDEDQFETVYYYYQDYLENCQDYSHDQIEDQYVEQTFKQNELQEGAEQFEYITNEIEGNEGLQSEYLMQVYDLHENQIENCQVETETKNEYPDYKNDSKEDLQVEMVTEFVDDSTVQ